MPSVKIVDVAFIFARTLKLSDRMNAEAVGMVLWSHGRFGAVSCWAISSRLAGGADLLWSISLVLAKEEGVARKSAPEQQHCDALANPSAVASQRNVVHAPFRCHDECERKNAK